MRFAVPPCTTDSRRRRVATYPEALRRRVVQDYPSSAEFALHAFAPKLAHRAGTYLTSSTIARRVQLGDRAPLRA